MLHRFPTFVTLAALAAWPVAAQTEASSFRDWKLTANGKNCFLSTSAKAGAQRMTFYREDDGSPDLRVDTGMSTRGHSTHPVVALSIDGEPWTNAGNVDDHDYLFDASNEGIASMLRGSTAEFSVDGTTLAWFSLDGFPEGLAAFERCVGELPDPPMHIPPPRLVMPAPAPMSDGLPTAAPPPPPASVRRSPSLLPPPPPPSRFNPNPVPLKESRWISSNDYIGIEGDVFFRLDINAKGKVTECTITRSSGNEALDAHTCKLLKKRAKFRPALDRSGAKMASSYHQSIRWRQ